MAVNKILIIMCLCVLFGSTISKKGKPKSDEDTYGALLEEDVQNDEYDEYSTDDQDEDPDDTNIPAPEEEHVEFLTQSQTIVANIGDTVRLPCEVSNPETVNIWQRDGTLLHQSHVAFEKDKYPNIREFGNNTLEVAINSENDYGNYACILITTNIIENRPSIVHKLVQPTPPKILAIKSENNRTEYKPGETLKLTCVVTGYPRPTISWHKGNERLELQGETIQIPNLTESSEGIYRCLADNHVQKPDHNHIQIFVESAPKITVGEYLVTSNKENDAELVCNVEAYPDARVSWKKGDDVVKSDSKRKISTKKRIHNTVESILVISNLTDEDFSTYYCIGKNRNGKREEKVTLVKVPAVRQFVKPEKANRDVVLTWKIESKLPISAHEIQYRKQGEEHWSTAKPEVTNGINGTYTVKYTLKDLDAGAYETRVRSRNEHGWSEFSDIMPFEGEKHISSVQEATSAPQQQEISQKEASVGESKPLSGTSVQSSMTILSIAMIVIFYLRQ